MPDFDEESWTIRYLVAETGTWLPGRRVLIPLGALRRPDWDQKRVPVRLSREQVRRSPHVDTHRPVSRAAEAAALTYYGYPVYWNGPALWGPWGSPALVATLPPTEGARSIPYSEDAHLRSCHEVIGYHIAAQDGDIGHVDDFLIDEITWEIESLLVDTSNWIGGERDPPASVRCGSAS